jgi:energy-converting hydrogenase Eha subunit G
MRRIEEGETVEITLLTTTIYSAPFAVLALLVKGLAIQRGTLTAMVITPMVKVALIGVLAGHGADDLPQAFEAGQSTGHG